MNFVICLLVFTNLKDESYKLIFVIIDCLVKLVYYKSIKITIDVSGLAEVIINMIVHHHNIPESIFTD